MTISDDLINNLEDFLVKEASPELVHANDEAHLPPLDLLQKIGELGYLGVGLPAEFDGFGGAPEIVRMMELLGYHYLALGHLAGRSIYVEQLLIHFGTEAQRARWLPEVQSGRAVFSVGVTEPEAGSDAGALRMRADREGDEYVLNGQKVWSSSMDYAAVVLVAARTAAGSTGTKGVSTFLVDRSTPGITCTKLNTVGDWGVGTYHVFYDDVRVPVDALFGTLDEGWTVITGHLIRERLIMAARAVGATKRVLDVIAKYVSERHQFGHPLAEFQVVQHKLADIATRHYMAQSALYRLAEQPSPTRAEASMVKNFAAETYCAAAIEAMQLGGGYAYTHDTEIQRHFRDSRVYPVGGGSAEVMRNIIGREVLKPFRVSR